MKNDIHPKYYTNAKVTCACGNAFETGSTSEEIRTDVCGQCHPFFTGQQMRIIDSAGQVERFNTRVERARQLREEEEQRLRDRLARENARRLVDLVDEEETVEPISFLADDSEDEE